MNTGTRYQLIMAVTASLLSPFAFSDDVRADESVSEHGGLARSHEVSETGSAASFDKRLPPVIPGEQIEHNGRKTRVWSTSGPVPVGSVPPAPPAPGNGSVIQGVPGNVGVIVDNRTDQSPGRPRRDR